MSFHLITPGDDRKTWTIRGRLFDGRIVKLPGHRDRKVAAQMMLNIESLNRSAQFGQLPQPDLMDWIAGLPQQEASRYVSYGLLPRHLVERRRPIDDLLKDYVAHVKTRCKNGSTSPESKVERIRRIFSAMNGDTFEDLTLDVVTRVVREMVALRGGWKGKPLSKKTQFEYFAAIKSFCMWMVKNKRSTVDPLDAMSISGARSAPVRNRRPLSVPEFRKLVDYLRVAPSRYAGQALGWTPTDRLMIYWVAVMTGFRAKELRSLTPAHIDFESNPTRITVDGWVAKNGQKATIPIDDRLARALREYCADVPPSSPLLKIPPLNALLRGFYRDLDAAGVRRKFDDGKVVDFHSLRATAICWWVVENKLHLLDVQFRARLKTLQLVQEYLDNYAPNHAALLQGTPLLLEDSMSFHSQR